VSLGVLLIGLGRIGVGYDLGTSADRHVYTHARAFSMHPAFHLLGGVDPDESHRARFQNEYEKPVFFDVETALGELQPEVVVIAVPTPAHGEMLQRVLKGWRPQAVLCEKPLAYDVDEARRMVGTCAQHGVSLYVNYMRRSDPGVIEVKRRLVNGVIANPVKGVAWYSKGLLHNGSHLFNMLAYWLGEMIDSQIIDAGRIWDARDPEPDVRVRFEKGTIVFLAAREEDYSYYTVELVTGNGRLRYEVGGEEIQWQDAVADSNTAGYTVLASNVETIASGLGRYQWHVVDQLASAMKGLNAHLCDGADALRTLQSLHILLEGCQS
jgi:predicted dehydrogenase